MIISTLTWALVQVVPDKPLPDGANGKSRTLEEYRDAYVTFEDKDGCPNLSIQAKAEDRSLFLARAKILSLNPWEAKFEAYYWSSSIKKMTFEYPHPRLVLIRCQVTCKFEDYQRRDIETERQEVNWMLKEAKKGPIRPVRDAYSGRIGLKVCKKVCKKSCKKSKRVGR